MPIGSCRFVVRFDVHPVLSRTLNCSHCRHAPLPSLPALRMLLDCPCMCRVHTRILTACVLCCHRAAIAIAIAIASTAATSTAANHRLSAAVVSTDAIAAIAIATHVHTCLHAEIYDEMVTILTNFAGLFCVFLSGVSVGVLRAILPSILPSYTFV